MYFIFPSRLAVILGRVKLSMTIFPMSMLIGRLIGKLRFKSAVVVGTVTV